jgi:hypothetical protein
MRLRSIAFRVFCFVFLLCIAIGVLMIRSPLYALYWHMTNGNRIHFEDCQLELPLLWWRVNTQADATEVVLKRGRIDYKFSLLTDEMHIVHNRTGVVNEQLTKEAQSRMLQELGRNTGSNAERMQISTVVGSFYCVRIHWDKESTDLFCQNATLPWHSSFLGTSFGESEAESLLATLKLR